MIIEPCTAVNVTLETIENIFESVDWLLDDAGVSETYVREFVEILSAMQTEVRAESAKRNREKAKTC